jgi:hypothetical protein
MRQTCNPRWRSMVQVGALVRNPREHEQLSERPRGNREQPGETGMELLCGSLKRQSADCFKLQQTARAGYERLWRSPAGAWAGRQR